MSSRYTIGAMNQLSDALESAGFTPDDVTKLKQFGNLEGIRGVVRGELVISLTTRLWHEENGIIRFSVTSNGTTGEEWIKRLKCENYAKCLLRSPDFKPTNGITTEIVVARGTFFTDSNRTTKNIRTEAEKRDWFKLNAEVACLIREKFSDKELEAMGLWWIVAMHEPIKDSGGDPHLLSVSRGGGGSWLNAVYFNPGDRWSDHGGFAFAVSQV